MTATDTTIRRPVASQRRQVTRGRVKIVHRPGVGWDLYSRPSPSAPWRYEAQFFNQVALRTFLRTILAPEVVDRMLDRLAATG